MVTFPVLSLMGFTFLNLFGLLECQVIKLTYYEMKKLFKFYCRIFELVSKFKVGLKHLLQQGQSEPTFYSDLDYIKLFVGLIVFFTVQRSYHTLQTYKM